MTSRFLYGRWLRQTDRRLAWMVGMAALCACGGTSVRGAGTEAPGREPAGAELARFVVRSCVDRSGARLQPSLGSEVLVQRGVRRPVVVEKRRGFDSLVITNCFEDADRLVAQAVVDTTGGKLIRQIVVPRAALVPGGAAVPALATLDIARNWSETDVGGGGFRATLGKSVVSCALEPVLPVIPSIQDAGAADAPDQSSSTTN